MPEYCVHVTVHLRHTLRECCYGFDVVVLALRHLTTFNCLINNKLSPGSATTPRGASRVGRRRGAHTVNGFVLMTKLTIRADNRKMGLGKRTLCLKGL